MPADTLIVLPTIAPRVNDAIRALAAVRAHVTIPHQVVCIADGINDAQFTALANAGAQLDARPERRGLTGAFNAGLAWFHQSPQYRFLWQLEDGIIIGPGLDDALRRTLTAHPQFGWVGAGQIENDRAPFTAMCSMMTREAATALGSYDLAFAPYPFDDADGVMRMRQAGFMPHGITVRVSHPEGRTSVAEPERRMCDWLHTAHQWIFAQKWGQPDFPWDQMPVHDPMSCRACIAAL